MIPRDNTVYPDRELIRAHLNDIRNNVMNLWIFNDEEDEPSDDEMRDITVRWVVAVEYCWMRLIAKGYEVLEVTAYEITFVRRQTCTTYGVWVDDIFIVKISWDNSDDMNAKWRLHYPINRGRCRFNGYNSFPPQFRYLPDEPDWQRSDEALLNDPNTGSLRYIPYLQNRSWKIISYAHIPRPEHIIDEHEATDIRNFLTEKKNAIMEQHSHMEIVKPLGINNFDMVSESVIDDMLTIIFAQWIRLLKTGYRVIAFSWYQMLVINRRDVDVSYDIHVYQFTMEMDRLVVGNPIGFKEPACKGLWNVPPYVFPPPSELSLTSGTATWKFPASRSYRFPV
jgi:hypothetical protein